jgi:hypothetical protein
MTIQAGTFKPLPPSEELLKMIENEKRHNADLTSYLWYVMPIVERFGEGVYAVAAESLTRSGVTCTADELRAMAEELKTPEGQARYAERRHYHLFNHVTG